MLILLRKFIEENKGATIIETAVILPIFIFMTMAIFELALMFFYSFVLESAMYSATRFAKVQPDPSAVVQEVRDRVGELSFGLMDPAQVIITTNLAVNFADNWENAEPELCGAPNLGETCATLPDCGGQLGTFSDTNLNELCDIGRPPLELGVPGAIISYVAFYKKDIITPGLGLMRGKENAINKGFLDSGEDDEIKGWHLISSATVTRNEPGVIN